MSINLNIPTPHPLKEKLRYRGITLWWLRRLLEGHPSEFKLSRTLNGIEEMPKYLEDQIQEVIPPELRFALQPFFEWQ